MLLKMADVLIDIFNHCLPTRYIEACRSHMAGPMVMFDRAVVMPGMSNLDERRRIMDSFEGYRQLLSLASPAPESIAGPSVSPELVRIGNDCLAEWCDRDPIRFPGFVASLPMNHPEAAILEARRALSELGAVGVQVYTHVNGLPLDRPEYLAVLEMLAQLNSPVWLHPLRSSRQSDYPDESISKFDLWWAFGWPHETSVCAGRLVFSGLFDRCPDLKIITHHAGGTIPMVEGRLDSGLAVLGTRYAPEEQQAAETPLQEPAIEAFRRFHADTATFGSRLGIEAAMAFFGSQQMYFATDFPFAGIERSIRSVEGLPANIQSGNAAALLQSVRHG